MNLYMIRHGQSTANADGTHSGWSCINLTEKGRKQAYAAKKNVEKLNIDKLFVSDVLRTQQTADILFPGMERSFITIARELNTTPMHGKTKEQMTAVFGDLYLECRDKRDYTPLHIDCESFSHAADRASEVLDMVSKLENVENVAIVSHAGFIICIAARVLGLDHFPLNLPCGNVSINHFEYKNGVWSLKMWNLEPEI